MARALDVSALIEPHQYAAEISNRFAEWNSYRQAWLGEKKELRNYVFATDTRTTSNAKLPWANSTTTPKLTQIYDNLKANYTTALFPSSNWMRWEATDEASATKQKRDTIQTYMDNKLRQSDFRNVVDGLVDDFILTGNCFATVDYVSDYTVLESGETVSGYMGPKLVRISPYDIVFDPTAADFASTPKIVRSIKTLGEIAGMAEKNDDMAVALEKMLGARQQVSNASSTEKSEAFVADGFGSIENYYQSSYVELLTFYGDLYDKHTGELKRNRIITVADRAHVVSDIPNPSWLGTAPIFHSGWRNRPDNLYAMGPLDNLVGLQYRIDHLENLKADVFDQIAMPMLKIRGDVEDFEYMPAGRVYIGEEGDVTPLVPDSTALNADFQIQNLEQKMEELAGAPKMAMGLRTAGEKTAFEVQQLDNAANRIFNHKSAKFEMEFLEPALNAMLEAARRNMNYLDTIAVYDDETGVQLFQSITKDDITAKGKIVPMGARHFAERAQRVQTLTQIMQIKASDPTVGVHMSGKLVAKLLAEELREDALYGENVLVFEQMATQKAQLDAEADMQEDLEVKAEQGL
jgi:disulfide oxidoreductase YuzD